MSLIGEDALKLYPKAYEIYKRVLGRPVIEKIQLAVMVDAEFRYRNKFPNKTKFKMRDIPAKERTAIENEYKEKLRRQLLLKDYHEYKIEAFLFCLAKSIKDEGWANSDNLKTESLNKLREFNEKDFRQYGWGAKRYAYAQAERFRRLIHDVGIPAYISETDDNGETNFKLSAHCEEWTVDMLKRNSSIAEWVTIMEDCGVNPRSIMPNLPYGLVSWEK